MYSIFFILLILLNFFKALVQTSSIQHRSIPIAEVTECVFGSVAQSCLKSVERGWSQGHFHKFKRSHEFYSDETTNCKLTYFSNEKAEVKLVNVDQIKAAILQIDDACKMYNVPVKSCHEQRKDSRGLFLGRLVSTLIIMTSKF
ncbi:hypothetical protein CROQUDRAFT_84410 [Cronartium quercuum f. sp. fusiforme G11]|uniref:Secreted protein n=1 Tax=Cronartium quercuum f. sp. fusiforme G11 TaxID=708437 RepID=A0A9P6N692_9BASI|nr:hypothetical protein CROQUDRAFT_84410 [Cronartium quercuum f. sp. fusiforme G11]